MALFPNPVRPSPPGTLSKPASPAARSCCPPRTALYEAYIHKFREPYSPFGDDELALVQSLADTEWRLERIPSLEMGIYALGRVEFASLFLEGDEAVRPQLIEAKIFLAYKKDLSNVSLQRDACGDRGKRMKPLKEVQGLRRQQEEAAAQTRLDRAAKLYIQAAHEGKSEEWEPERPIASAEGMPLGFEFTMAQIEMRALQIEPDLFQEWAPSHQKR